MPFWCRLYLLFSSATIFFLASLLISQYPCHFHYINCISSAATTSFVAAPLLIYLLKYGSSAVSTTNPLPWYFLCDHITTPVDIVPYFLPPFLHLQYFVLCFATPLPHHWFPWHICAETYISIFMYCWLFYLVALMYQQMAVAVLVFRTTGRGALPISCFCGFAWTQKGPSTLTSISLVNSFSCWNSFLLFIESCYPTIVHIFITRNYTWKGC